MTMLMLLKSYHHPKLSLIEQAPLAKKSKRRLAQARKVYDERKTWMEELEAARVDRLKLRRRRALELFLVLRSRQ